MFKVAKTLDELHHYQMFRTGLQLGDWVWCLHCQRAYQYGEFREEVDSWGEAWQLCPYDDCDGTSLDLWPWGVVRDENPDYPEIPERGKVYLLYP